MQWIVTAHVRREVWRRLFEFANEEVAVHAIALRHGPASGASMAGNYRKQARQIRAVLFQAKEYFEAAEQASFHTSPNHLYYGMVCLASAVMLLNGTGDQSLDVLRLDPANRNHGLDFSLGSSSANAGVGTHLLEDARVAVRERGHFPNWYDLLPPIMEVFGIITRLGGSLETRSWDAIGAAPRTPGSSLVGTNTTLLGLLRHVPDFHSEWERYGISVPISRAMVELLINGRARTHTLRFIINGATTAAAFDAILEGFKVPATYCDIPQLLQDSENSGAVSYTSVPGSTFIPLNFPDIRGTLDEVQLIYGEAIGTPEWADVYRACFGLSMLSRYYPDYWIKCLESQCISAKLVERFVDIYSEKFPTLALSYLAREKIVVSTQSAPCWH